MGFVNDEINLDGKPLADNRKNTGKLMKNNR
jgi:hypothetical protein